MYAPFQFHCPPPRGTVRASSRITFPETYILTERTKNYRKNLTKSASLVNPPSTSKQSRRIFFPMENSYTSSSQTQTATSTSSNSTPTVRLLFPPLTFANLITLNMHRPQIPLRYPPPPPHNLPHRPLPFNPHPPPFLLLLLALVSTSTIMHNRLPRTDYAIININIQNPSSPAGTFAKYLTAAAWV